MADVLIGEPGEKLGAVSAELDNKRGNKFQTQQARPGYFTTNLVGATIARASGL